jgi:hypothetical protein
MSPEPFGEALMLQLIIASLSRSGSISATTDDFSAAPIPDNLQIAHASLSECIDNIFSLGFAI